jgi:hypothetical protein
MAHSGLIRNRLISYQSSHRGRGPYVNAALTGTMAGLAAAFSALAFTYPEDYLANYYLIEILWCGLFAGFALSLLAMHVFLRLVLPGLKRWITQILTGRLLLIKLLDDYETDLLQPRPKGCMRLFSAPAKRGKSSGIIERLVELIESYTTIFRKIPGVRPWPPDFRVLQVFAAIANILAWLSLPAVAVLHDYLSQAYIPYLTGGGGMSTGIIAAWIAVFVVFTSLPNIVISIQKTAVAQALIEMIEMDS